MTAEIAVLTNARAARQQSMIGYGDLVLRAARRFARDVVEFRATSALSELLPQGWSRGRSGKLVRDIERFLLSPARFVGRRTRLAHVVDPGNVIYLDMIRCDASIVAVHDMIPFHCAAGRLNGFRPSRSGLLLMRRVLAKLKRADRIVCVSEATRRDLLTYADVDPGRIVVIPNAVFQPLERAPAEACRAIRSEFGLPADVPLVLHVGRNFYKNRETVLRVFARIHRRHPDARLLFVGGATEALAGAVREEGLGDRVHFADHVPSEKMAALYTTATLLLFPSLYEGFGYPVLEAQLCGTPVICSNAGSLPEVAGDGAILFAPDDVEGMAEAATELIGGQSAAALVALGYSNVERFASPAWCNAHTKLYRELL